MPISLSSNGENFHPDNGHFYIYPSLLPAVVNTDIGINTAGSFDHS